MPETRIGISGWRYVPWRGKFYPASLSQDLELNFAARCVNSIEINGSFYSLQSPNAYQRWYDATPDDFVFAVKGSRFITHMKRLKNVEQAQANFWASGILRLEEKLGPILWQLPPNFQFVKETLEKFFDELPRNTADAAKIARGRSDFMKDRSWTKVGQSRPLRHAIEIRHESFMTEEFVNLLRTKNVALVVADTAGKWPYMEDMTADFVYARLHGEIELYASGYDDLALDRWARRLRKWRKGGRDVFVYFDNDMKVFAPFNAMDLARRLGIRRDYEEIRRDSVLSGRPKSTRDNRRSPWPRRIA
jgi:uncharacterized protein YecE (DUF72 family)